MTTADNFQPGQQVRVIDIGAGTDEIVRFEGITHGRCILRRLDGSDEQFSASPAFVLEPYALGDRVLYESRRGSGDFTQPAVVSHCRQGILGLTDSTLNAVIKGPVPAENVKLVSRALGSDPLEDILIEAIQNIDDAVNRVDCSLPHQLGSSVANLIEKRNALRAAMANWLMRRAKA